MDQSIKSNLNDLEEAVLGVLVKHQGVENTISRTALTEEIRFKEFTVNDRGIRRVICDLRKKGHLACSTEKGGYFLATSFGEYESFRRREYASRIQDMAETMRSMDMAAHKEFVESAVQPGLF